MSNISGFFKILDHKSDGDPAKIKRILGDNLYRNCFNENIENTIN